jgi:son of sevenless
VLRTASSISYTSLPRYEEVAPSQSRNRAGSLPTRSRSIIKQQPIDERSTLLPLSIAKEPNDINSEIAKSNALPDGLVKRSRSQKLKQAMGFVDTRSQPVVQTQPVVPRPWALQPAYSAYIQMDNTGNSWGTLDALIDKLTTNAPPRDPIRESIRRTLAGPS